MENIQNTPLQYESFNSPAQPSTILSQNKLKLIISLIVLLLIFASVVYVLYRKNSQSQPIPSPTAVNTNNNQEKDSTENKIAYWEIFDNSQSPKLPTGLKITANEFSDSAVARWKNYLLGMNVEHYVAKSGGAFLGNTGGDVYTLSHQIRSIRVFNMDNGDTFDISLDKPIWGEFWYETSQVVDDTYYFGVGGAYGASLGYRLELPPQRGSKITKLPSTIGNSIAKYQNTYVSSFCYEGCTYFLLDKNALTTKPLERMTSAFNDKDYTRKEEFIGIDSQGRMIVNVRGIPKDANNQQHLDTEMLAASPLTNESITTTLTRASDLPEKMRGYFMIDGIDKIIMLGNSKTYIYDINSNKTKEIQIGVKLKEDLSSDKSYNYYSATKTKSSVCFIGENNIKYAIDIINETYLETPPSDCKKLWAEKTQDEVFEELNLPSNFEFVYTTSVLKLN